MQYDENAERYGYEGEMTPMKCDELIPHKADVTIPVYGTIADTEVYLKEKTDEAIAELKEAWHSEHAACEALKAKLEDAGMRERRLKRTLYKACANWALSTLAWLDCIDQGEPKNWSKMTQQCLKKAEEFK